MGTLWASNQPNGETNENYLQIGKDTKQWNDFPAVQYAIPENPTSGNGIVSTYQPAACVLETDES